MASSSHALYVGVTNDLGRRVREHKEGLVKGFTKQYHVNQLVHYEEFVDIRDAIAREKELKGWRRSRKIGLLEKNNLAWQDLAAGWGGPVRYLTSLRVGRREGPEHLP